MKKNPKISVIVNCLNGSKFVEKCLKNILNQTYKDIEIIFWDNNSTDNSFNIANKINSKKIKIFKSRQTDKLYSARNKAIKRSKGEYLAFLDIDDFWYKSKLKEQVEKLKITKADLVFTEYINLKNEKRTRIRSRFIHGKDFIKEILIYMPISISTILVKKKSAKAIGYFNEKYEIIGDLDFYFRFCQKYKISSIDKPLAQYLIHGENFSLKKMLLRVREIRHWLNNLSNKHKIVYKEEIKHIIDTNNYLELSHRIYNKKKIYLHEVNKIESYFLKLKILIKFVIACFK